MGDDFASDRIPPLEIRARGTAPIAEVDVIRNEQYVFTTKPGKQDISLRFTDMDHSPWERHYYVRIQQADGQLAWASPIWVRLR